MAMSPYRPAYALRRRITTYSLATDVAASLIIGLFISSLLGTIVFVLGLIVTGLIYYNFTKVMRTRGIR